MKASPQPGIYRRKRVDHWDRKRLRKELWRQKGKRVTEHKELWKEWFNIPREP